MRRLSVEVKQMAYDDPTVLDGTNPTLDASDLSYEFEKARINGATNEDVDSLYFKEENKIMPLNFTYLSSFRDPVTGTRHHLNHLIGA